MKIEAPELSSRAGLRHAFFTRQGGVSEGFYSSLNGGVGSSDDPARVAENRRRMAEALGVEAHALVSVRQVHSPRVAVVREPFGLDARPEADAMATATPGIALAIATADCGPVLLADPAAGVVGAAHAGWKGATGGVLEAVVEAMEGLGARRGRMVAVLGPTIGPAAYEVGPEFVERLLGLSPGNAAHLAPSPREGHAYFDLPAYILARLAAMGLAEVADLGLCTYADEARFYSYRRTTHRGEPDYGRLISGIALVG